MKNYIVHSVGEYDSDTSWFSSDKTPDDIMWDTINQFSPYRMSINIMEVDTLEVVDDEEGYTPGDVFEDYLRDGDDGDTASGITRLGLWVVVSTAVRENNPRVSI